MRNSSPFRRFVECCEQVLSIVPALGAFGRDNLGKIGERARKEMSGHLNVRFAGSAAKCAPRIAAIETASSATDEEDGSG